MKKILLIPLLLLVFSSFAFALNDSTYYVSFDSETLNVNQYDDLSGNSNPVGSVAGAFENASGLLNEAVTFDGINDYLDPNFEMTTTGQGFSVATWVYFDSLDVDAMIISKDNVATRDYYFNARPDDRLFMRFDGMSPNNFNSAVNSNITAGRWNHVGLVVAPTFTTFYLNGAVLSNHSWTGTLSYGAVSTRIAQFGSGTNTLNGSLDEFAFYANRILTTQDYEDLYNAGVGFNPYTPLPTITNSLPVNNTRTNNETLYFVANTTELANGTSLELFFNSTSYGNFTVSNNQVVANLTNLTDGEWNWYFNYNNEVNSTTQSFINYDTVLPIYTENFLNTDNSSVFFTNGASSYILNFTGNATDTYLFSINYSILNSSGGVLYNDFVNNLTASSWTINNSFDIAPYNQTLIQEVIIADDHTVISIPDDWTFSRSQNTVSFVTDTNTISIESEIGNLRGFTSEYRGDRYSFSFEAQNARTEWGFNLACDDTIYYRGDLWPYPVFVCGNNWIDFNTPMNADIIVSLRPNGQYNINVKTQQSSDRIDFNSIGGLNIVNYTYEFTVNNQSFPKAPNNPIIYGVCEDIVLNSTNTTITLNMSNTNDDNGDFITHDVFLRNSLYDSLLDTGLAPNLTLYDFNITKTSYLTDSYNWLVYTNDSTGLSNSTISSCSFNICINNWVASFGACLNDSRFVTYTDSNACSIAYDVPIDNGTYVSCEDGFLTDEEFNAVSAQVLRENNYLLMIALLLAFIIAIKFLARPPFLFNAVLSALIAMVGVYTFTLFSSPLVPIMIIIVGIILLLIDIFNQ